MTMQNYHGSQARFMRNDIEASLVEGLVWPTGRAAAERSSAILATLQRGAFQRNQSTFPTFRQRAIFLTVGCGSTPPALCESERKVRKTIDRASARLHQFNILLCCKFHSGAELTKYCRTGTKQQRFVQVSPSGDAVGWRSRGKSNPLDSTGRCLGRTLDEGKRFFLSRARAANHLPRTSIGHFEPPDTLHAVFFANVDRIERGAFAYDFEAHRKARLPFLRINRLYS